MRHLLRIRPLIGRRQPRGIPQTQLRIPTLYGGPARHSSSDSSAAKYSLPKLSSQEMSELRGKIEGYSHPQLDSAVSGTAPAPGAHEADSVRLTDSAIRRLKHLSEKRGATQYLRLRVDSGGCYGFSYMLDMTEEPEADDVVIDRNGAKMVIDTYSLPLVRGATIDWQDRLIGQAFLVVANPQSSGGCGCGASFEIKMD
ncbi:[4Fe-4S] proteins maturation [Coemansia sp. RSA 2711]|nr:[4Fe-4S] proteins maturation [Coemansia sp. RSA 2711]